ncbi:MAG: Hpt domain-containing protein [Candidatus Aminicenantes bacterium]|nr:Hpt domain-containing protein [Candidatus Aminicenantes bacterium]
MTADSGIPMNKAEALDRVGGDEAFLRELLDMYAAEYAEKTGAMENAIRAADFRAIRDLGHGLKGSSANLSLPQLQDAAFDMETAGLEKDLEGALKALNRLGHEYRRLKDYLGTP